MIDLDEVAPALMRRESEAFAWFLARAEPALRRKLASFAVHVDVEAVLQESLLRFWQVAPRFRPDGRPNGLLRLALRIARNTAIDELRRRRGERSLDELGIADEPSIEPIEPDPLLRDALERCRAGLPRRPRAALDARVNGGGASPDPALAERVGMRLNTFLQNLSRARRLLAECLERRGIRLEEVLR